MIPYNAQGVAPSLLHPVSDRPAAISALQGDRFTATLGTDLLEVTYEVTRLSECECLSLQPPTKHAVATSALRHMFLPRWFFERDR